MEKLSVEGKNIVLQFEGEELRFLHQALNEILNGVGFTDADLSTRLGANRDELQTLMQQLGGVLDEAQR